MIGSVQAGPVREIAQPGTTILVLTAPWPRVYRWQHLMGVGAFSVRWWWYDEDEHPLTDLQASWAVLA